jgi:opacity protein-like surface antigen
MRRIAGLLFVVALFASIPAQAQAQERKYYFNIGGGYTFSLSEVREHLGDGGNFALGATFMLNDWIGIQGEYGYTGLGEKRIPKDIPGAGVTNFDVHGSMHYGTANLVFGGRPARAIVTYFVGGVGVYNRPVTLTTPTVGFVPGFCDPYWYVCWPGGFVEVDQVITSRSSTDFGINVGVGLNFSIKGNTSAYFEVRYHYIWGPEITNNAGASQGKANGQFLPLTFGIRF